MVGAPACGDVMRLQIQVVITVSLKMRALKPMAVVQPLPQAHWLQNGLKGKTLDETSAIKTKISLKSWHLLPVKVFCSVLAEDAIKAAIEDYKSKLKLDWFHDCNSLIDSSSIRLCVKSLKVTGLKDWNDCRLTWVDGVVKWLNYQTMQLNMYASFAKPWSWGRYPCGIRTAGCSG